MSAVFQFLIVTLDGVQLTWTGGGLKLSDKPDHVWLTSPAGKPVLEVHRSCVRPISSDEHLKLLNQAKQRAKQPWN